MPAAPRFLTDESVRWLAQNDKKQEAKRILLKIAKRNKRVLAEEQGIRLFCCVCLLLCEQHSYFKVQEVPPGRGLGLG